jgi:hypothetical protein
MSQNSFMQKMQAASEKIEQAQEEKKQIIEDFLVPVEEICNLLLDFWNVEKEKSTVRLKKMAAKVNFNVIKESEFSIRSIHDKLTTLMPILNGNNEGTCENLPECNSEWIVEDLSTDEKTIHISINPINLNSRYPTDPDENYEQFDYIMPTLIHNKFINQDSDRKAALREYFNYFLESTLTKLEEQMIEKNAALQKKSTEEKIQGLDFNDPVVVAAIKERMKIR